MDADDEDFRDFVTARSAALLRTAYLLQGDWASAEDLLQSALAKAYRHWSRLRRDGDPVAYVRTIMVNERRSWWRRTERREVLGSELPERLAPDEATAIAERDALWRAVQALPSRMRAVLVLRYWEDLSEAETAHVLGCSVGTVKSQASRGLRRLKKAITPDGAPIAVDPTGTDR